MSTTLEKVKQMEALKSRLSSQIKEFEQQYHLPSSEFYTRYEQGKMGDEIDFIEWASTLEMLDNVTKRLTILGSNFPT